MIDKTTNKITCCSCCEKDSLHFTYKVEKEYFCKDCVTRKVFGKVTKFTSSLVDQFKDSIDYGHYLNVARDVLTMTPGPMRLRAWRARRSCPSSFIFRKITHSRYVILCPAGKIYVEAENPKTPPPVYIDAEAPFDSICGHVERALDQGFRIEDIAAYIWKIRGKYDNITAMMYPEYNYVIVTCPREQRKIYKRSKIEC